MSYSLAQQQQASKELRAMGKSAAQIKQMIIDYKKTRAACRAGGSS